MKGHDAPRGFFEIPQFTRDSWERLGAKFPADGGRGKRSYRWHPSRAAAKKAQRKIENDWKQKAEHQGKVRLWNANYQEKRLTRKRLRTWLKLHPAP